MDDYGRLRSRVVTTILALAITVLLIADVQQLSACSEWVGAKDVRLLEGRIRGGVSTADCGIRFGDRKLVCAVLDILGYRPSGSC